MWLHIRKQFPDHHCVLCMLQQNQTEPSSLLTSDTDRMNQNFVKAPLKTPS